MERLRQNRSSWELYPASSILGVRLAAQRADPEAEETLRLIEDYDLASFTTKQQLLPSEPVAQNRPFASHTQDPGGRHPALYLLMRVIKHSYLHPVVR
jgi:hypothetical protein